MSAIHSYKGKTRHIPRRGGRGARPLWPLPRAPPRPARSRALRPARGRRVAVGPRPVARTRRRAHTACTQYRSAQTPESTPESGAYTFDQRCAVYLTRLDDRTCRGRVERGLANDE